MQTFTVSAGAFGRQKVNSSRKTNRKVYPRNYGPVHTTKYRQVETAFFSSFNSNRVSIVHTWNWVFWREVR